MGHYQKVQVAYDQIVFDFAKRNHFQMADNLVALAQETAQHIGQKGNLVDIGCGTGRDMAWFESQGIAITGIDLSMGMLAYARENVHGNLVSMNMRYLGFRDACFDGAWCCASLLHLPKAEAVYALQEIHRILKSGGWLILFVQEGNGEGWEEGVVPGIEHFFARYQGEEMQCMLSQNRFTVLETGSSQTPKKKWLSYVSIAE